MSFWQITPAAPKPQAAQASPISFTPPPIPAAPTVGVTNPGTAEQKSFLRALLDPNSSTYLGNKYRPQIAYAGQQLRAGLSQFGDYSFTEGDLGTITATKKDTDQPGRLYKDAYTDQRAAAAAAGMLYSRRAEQAVGEAWSRLGQQEQAMFSQYAGAVNQQISAMQGEFTGVGNQLISLYGQDVQYALDNPVLADPPAETAADGGGAAPDWFKSFSESVANGDPTPIKIAPKQPDAKPLEWRGKAANVKTLAKAWGVPVSQIEVRDMGGGGQVARIKGTWGR